MHSQTKKTVSLYELYLLKTYNTHTHTYTHGPGGFSLGKSLLEVAPSGNDLTINHCYNMLIYLSLGPLIHISKSLT